MNRKVLLRGVVSRLVARSRRDRDSEAGFTLVEMIMGVTVLGIIMVPLAMAIAVGFRATLQTHQRLAQAQDAQAVSAYFPADVQSVDASGFNPTDSVNEDVCPADPADPREELPLALFVWNQDLGVNGQSVARYIARGKGVNSELVRRFCKTTSDGSVDVVLAKNFGEGATTSAADYFTDPGAVDPARNETPACGSRTCTLLIHGSFDYRLSADRRVKGTTNNNTIPGRPTNVHTTGGNQRATIYWDAPIDDGGAPIEQYYIQNMVTLAITGPYTTPAGDPPGAGEPGQLGVTITGLTNGQGYTFRVRARNALGPGAFSDPSTAVTPGPTVADPPTIGVATADPEVAGKAAVTWSLPPGYNDGGSPLTGFRIYAQNAPTPALTVDVPGGGATGGAITTLANNTRYQLQVSALSAIGESSPSASSNQVLTLPGKPGTPTASSNGALGNLKLTFTPPSGGDFTDLTNLQAHIVETNTYATPVSAASACPTAASGTCQVTVAGVVPGQTVKVRAENATGWGADSDAATGIDVVAPVVTLTTPAANAVLDTGTPTFSGTAGTAAGDRPTITVRVYSGATTAGALVQTRTTSASSGAWTVTGSPDLGDGQFTAQASQSDAFGNVGLSGTRTFSVDRAPVVTITAPADGSATSNVTPTISGAAGTWPGPIPSADGIPITVKLYSGATPTGAPLQTKTVNRAGANWSVAASTLAEGQYTVTASQTDGLLQTGVSAPVTFVVDKTKPTVTITAPTANQPSNDGSFTFSGAAGTAPGPSPSADSATVTVKVYAGSSVNGAPIQTRNATRSGASWSVAASPALSSGTYTVQASQSDAAGNIGMSTAVTFLIDTTPPTVTITAPTANQVISSNSEPVAFTFTGKAGSAGSPNADDAQVSVKVYAGSSVTGSLVQTRNVNRSGVNWSVATSPNLAYGAYTVQTTQGDAAGNTGASAAVTFQVVPKHVRVATPANGGSAGGDGTALAPMDTVAHGIAKAQALGWTQVDVAQGTYDEGPLGVALVDDVDIAGGWTQDFGAQSGANTSTVIQGGQQAALASGDTGITLSRLMLSGLGDKTVDLNVYGLRAVSSSSVTLSNVRVKAASGFDGTDGAEGANGANGDHGDQGDDASGTSGGDGGNGGSGGTVATAGDGGDGGNHNQNGGGGEDVGSADGGSGGSRGGSGSCKAGSNGGAGDAGANGGAGGSGAGGSNSLTAGNPGAIYVGDSGESAANGTNGASGAGGGGGGGSGAGCSSSSRSGGGGGGGGGQGAKAGTAGTGGTYGGGSFGVYTNSSSVILDSASSVTAGSGGAGGNGGNGGSGGSGGAGGDRGDSSKSKGGDGGQGGKGGDAGGGGRGGGGAGGPSVALFDRGSGSITQGGASLSIGSGGSGGAPNGGNGLAQNTAAN